MYMYLLIMENMYYGFELWKQALIGLPQTKVVLKITIENTVMN